jgi:hypothetical protein
VSNLVEPRGADRLFIDSPFDQVDKKVSQVEDDGADAEVVAINESDDFVATRQDVARMTVTVDKLLR